MVAVLMLFALPVFVLPLVWLVNRYATSRILGRRFAFLFWLSAASPLLIMLTYMVIWGVSNGSPLDGLADPKALTIISLIGVPLSLVATMVAYRGSRGRTA